MKRKIIIASGIVLGIASYLMLLKQLQKIETLPQASSAEPKAVAIESDDKNHQTKVKVKVEGSSKPSQSEKKNQLMIWQRSLTNIVTPEVSPSQMRQVLEKLGLPVQVLHLGHPASGERLVIESRPEDGEIAFFQASFNKFSDGGTQLGFARYIVNSHNQTSDETAAIYTDLFGDSVPTDRGGKRWQTNDSFDVVVMDDHSEPGEPQLKGTLVSYELDIH